MKSQTLGSGPSPNSNEITQSPSLQNQSFPCRKREIPLSLSDRREEKMGSKRKREIPLCLSDRREEKMGSKKVTLKSSDGQVFEVDEAAALESQVIKMMIEDNCANGVIPLPKVTSKILSKVIEYCEKHVEIQKPGEDNNPLDEDLKSWDADFVKVDMQTLLDLIDAATYLIIESLVDLTSQRLRDMLQLFGKALTAHVEKGKEKEKEQKRKKERRLLAIMAYVEEQREGRQPLPLMAFMERWEEERRLLALMYF